ncbi:MAG TPA: hypothetical protein VKM55_30010 [Candidatus Lokiarchaeia archaeon]|nr:hypothetical protein [Candidatus Lokiarchaeia archaeon]
MIVVIVIAGMIGRFNCRPGSPEAYLQGDICGLGEGLIGLFIDLGILIACIIIVSIRVRDTW